MHANGDTSHRIARRLPALAAALTTLVAGVALASPTPASAAASGTTSARRTSSDVDAGSREAVTAAYQQLWAPAANAPVIVSGGDPSTCTPYNTSPATQARTRDAINFARLLAGMRPVSTVSDDHTAAAARSALLQAANRTLTHNPASTLLCWTRAAATAASHSNLDLRWSSSTSYLPTVGDVVSDYLVDRGSNNVEVGHRRWLLYPPTSTMGSGNAVADSGGARYVANNVWVLPSTSTSVPAGTPAFYGWPTQGWFPSPLEPEGRWSLSSSNGAGFAHATVRVTHDGANVPVTVRPYATGYGDNTLVWDLATPPKASGATPETYDVTVSGITGAARSTYSYQVRLFDPTWTDPSWGDLSSIALGTVTPERPATSPRRTAIRLRLGTHRLHRHHGTRLRIHVVGYGGTPKGRVVVRIDGRRVGSWSLSHGNPRVRLHAPHRFGRHRVVVHYRGTSHWAGVTARTTLRTVR